MEMQKPDLKPHFRLQASALVSWH
ncbi:Protein of unknown function [Pyronema omphalodes CBS 100304]|uniref:Uncharacterized protein n=1 Tax=Pyronema omphalodes (strain CBS 100304) TaxID=1076935 RepID=U4LR34_PYROM|nr:Protein of unknown function [Pyronema omphalodes CBS 100304]